MEKGRGIGQVYGYIVCVIAIITALISISMIVGSIFNLQDPLRSTSPSFFGPTANLSSFESYKIDILTGRADYSGTDDKDQSYMPSDTELKAAYDATKEDHIAKVKLDAARSITNGIILILIAAALFFGHWKWLNKNQA